jgi:hypothetical protein
VSFLLNGRASAPPISRSRMPAAGRSSPRTAYP